MTGTELLLLSLATHGIVAAVGILFGLHRGRRAEFLRLHAWVDQERKQAWADGQSRRLLRIVTRNQ